MSLGWVVFVGVLWVIASVCVSVLIARASDSECSGNIVAPKGKVWVCGACGKRSRDRYGEQAINSGWDESCMLNAVLCEESSLTLGESGRVLWGDAVDPPKDGKRIITDLRGV